MFLAKSLTFIREGQAKSGLPLNLTLDLSMEMTPDSIKWLLDHAASTYEAEIQSTDRIRERISFILSLTITPCFGVAAYLASSLRGEIFAPVNIFLFWIPLFIAVSILLVSTDRKSVV